MTSFNMYTPGAQFEDYDSPPPPEDADDVFQRLSPPARGGASARLDVARAGTSARLAPNWVETRTTRLPEDFSIEGAIRKTGGQADGIIARSAGTRLLVEEQDILETCRTEYDEVSREVTELRLVIQQSVLELAKLNQRKDAASKSLEAMEGQLQMYAREQIRDAYLAASEAEMRAFMIAEQLDQMRAKLRAYERYERFLKRTVELVETLPLVGGAPPTGPLLVAPSGVPGTAEPPEDSILDIEMMHTRLLTPEEDAAALVQSAESTQARAATVRVVQAEEEVRSRVSDHLHDRIMQSLVNLALSAEICERAAHTDQAATLDELSQLKQLIYAMLREATQSMLALRPLAPDGQSLVTTLKRYVTAVTAERHIAVRFTVPYGERELAPDKALAIFRVAQEAVTNVVRHSGATELTVTAAFVSDGFMVTLEDNGAGFDVDATLARAARHETAGVLSMLERAELLGGMLRIQSTPGQGTRVELGAPLP
ncbi:MAG: ATP-binding protein [Ktedonobacterales bacterium]